LRREAVTTDERLTTQDPSSRSVPRRASLLAGAALALAWASAPTSTLAAEAPAPAPATVKPKTVSEVVVQPEAVAKGTVVGDIKPDIQLQQQDVQAYGVSTITELLDELAPLTNSNAGRGGEGPAVLVNGRRISSLNEIRNIPTEAILRVDILPEEAALTYGFTANQRVVNIVLKDHVGADLLAANGGAATEGGGAAGQAEIGRTRISGDHRFNIDLKVNANAALTEAERSLTSLAAGTAPFDVAGNVTGLGPNGEIDPALSALAGKTVVIAGVPLAGAARTLTLADFLATANVPNVTDVKPFRTLAPEMQKVSLNATRTQPVFWDIQATLNGTLEATSTDARRGLPGVSLDAPAGGPFSPFSQPVVVDRYIPGFGPLHQTADSWTGHLGASLNRDLASWRLALTGNYDHSDSWNANDLGLSAVALQAAINAGTVNPFGPLPANLFARLAQDTSHARSDSGNVQFIASGPILTLPAGPLRTSVRVGATAATFISETGGLVTGSSSFTQDQANAQLSIDVPLTSRSRKVLGAIGDLGLNGHAEVQEVSGFGTLIATGYGAHWTPIQGLSILATWQRDEAAPTQPQLRAPVLLTPNSRIFDFVTGRTVDVTQISGGNPALTDDSRDRTSLRINWQPFADKQLTLRADYNRIHYRRPITTFPAVTADIEAAFPDRFQRDAEGTLEVVDLRPVNFTSQDVETLRWGFDWSRPIGPRTQPPARNQVFQQLRRAGLAGQVGRRPGGPGGAGGPGGPGVATPLPGEPTAPNAPPEAAAAPPPSESGPPQGFRAPEGGGGGGFGGRGGGPGGPGGFRGGGPGGGGPQDGRLHISVFHTVYFTDRFLVRPGGPVIDFLNGASLGQGGRPQHEVQAQINIAERGFGGELSADWKSGTQVIGATPAGDLGFSGLWKINARLFADLNQRKTLIEQHPWLKGVRLSVGIQNLFDQRMKVTDPTGATPLNFQPAYLDALGRTWRIEVRKLFASGV
jgi:hypothetical protein